MANAGYLGSLGQATTLGGTYTKVDGIQEASLPMAADEVDVSALKDADGWRRFIYALGGGEISASGHYISTDTQQGNIRSAFINKTTTFLQVLTNATVGFKGEFLIVAFEVGAPVEGASPRTIRARLTGAPTVV